MECNQHKWQIGQTVRIFAAAWAAAMTLIVLLGIHGLAGHYALGAIWADAAQWLA